MSAAALSQLDRARRIGPRVAARKIGIRCWSSRVSIFLSRAIEPRQEAGADLALQFAAIEPCDLDIRELGPERLRGADLLYVEGILNVHRQRPGDLIVGRRPDGALVVVGLLSYADRHRELELAAPGLYPRLQPDECWTEAYFVLPAFRRQRVMVPTLAATRDLLAEKGFKRMYAVISIDNVPSMRAFARAGYAPTGTIRHEQFRLNRFSSWFAEIDDVTRSQWERATSDCR